MAEKNDKVLLTICDQELSSSLSRVLNLQDSYSFGIVNIDPTNYLNLEALLDQLEQFKDNSAVGIFLTDVLIFNNQSLHYDSYGVELIKHIRLTKELEGLCCLPIVLLSSEMIMLHLKAKRDNMLLISPKCHPIQNPFSINELDGIIRDLSRFESPEDMKEEIKPFIAWSKEDDVISQHDNFNRYGPFKLLKEHFGDLPDYLSKNYSEITKKLWFKKYQFIEAKQTLPLLYDPEFNEDDFTKIVLNKKLLYIDDEHRLGWSYALYSITTGTSDDNLFQSGGHLIASPDGRFVCIDNYEEAIKLFKSYEDELIDALSEYSDTEQNKRTLSEEFTIIEKNYKGKKGVLEAAQEKSKEYHSEIEKIEGKIKGLENYLLSERTKDDLFDSVATFIDKNAIDDLSSILGKIKELSDDLIGERQELDKHKTSLKANAERSEQLQKEFEQIQSKYEEIKTRKLAMEKRFNDACSRLCPFEFDLILLDLRLKKKEDKDIQSQEISGIKLLGQIKKIDPSTPVVILTASEKALNYKEAVDLGASGYWIKVVNTATDLKSEIIECLKITKEIRNLWLDIRKVEAKKQLAYFYETLATAQQLDRGVMPPIKKNNVVSLLKESFLLLQRELSPYEKSICNYTSNEKIALNMGLIQEERLYKIKGERYNYWNKKGKISPDEEKVRDIRHQVAHEAGTKISYKEALEVFQKTIVRCLMY